MDRWGSPWATPPERAREPDMNYAASLAVLMVLAFVFPLLVRLAVDHGVERSTTTTALFVLAAFGFAVATIRGQVASHRARLERLLRAREQIEREPQSPQSFFSEGEHVGLLLLRLGRRREASELIDRYAQLPGAPDSEVCALREALTRAERRLRRMA